MMIAQVVLGLVANAVAEREVRLHLPIRLRIQAQIGQRKVDLRYIDLRQGKLARCPGLIIAKARIRKRAIRIALRILRLACRTQASAHANEVLLQLQRRVVLHLIVVLMVRQALRERAAVGKRSLNRHVWRRIQWRRCHTVALILKVRLIDQPQAERLRITHLQLNVLRMRIVRRRGQRQVSEAQVVLIVLHILKSRCQHVLIADREIHARRNIHPRLRRIGGHLRGRRDAGRTGARRRRSRRARRRRSRRRIQRRIRERIILDLPIRSAYRVGCDLAQRSRQAPKRKDRVVRRHIHASLQRILGVELRCVSIDLEVAMHLVRTRLCEDLDASIAQLVVLRRKRILVDANLTNRRLRRQLPARESVHVDLPAVRSRGWSRQRRQFARQLIRIIRQRIQVLPRQYRRTLVRVRIHTQLHRVRLYRNHLRLHANLQLCVERRAHHRGNLHVDRRVGRKALHRHQQRIRARRYQHTIRSVRARLHRNSLPRGRRQRNRRTGNQLPIRIRDRPMDSRSSRLNHRRSRRRRRLNLRARGLRQRGPRQHQAHQPRPHPSRHHPLAQNPNRHPHS